MLRVILLSFSTISTTTASLAKAKTGDGVSDLGTTRVRTAQNADVGGRSTNVKKILTTGGVVPYEVDSNGKALLQPAPEKEETSSVGAVSTPNTTQGHALVQLKVGGGTAFAAKPGEGTQNDWLEWVQSGQDISTIDQIKSLSSGWYRFPTYMRTIGAQHSREGTAIFFSNLLHIKDSWTPVLRDQYIGRQNHEEYWAIVDNDKVLKNRDARTKIEGSTVFPFLMDEESPHDSIPEYYDFYLLSKRSKYASLENLDNFKNYLVGKRNLYMEQWWKMEGKHAADDSAEPLCYAASRLIYLITAAKASGRPGEILNSAATVSAAGVAGFVTANGITGVTLPA